MTDSEKQAAFERWWESGNILAGCDRQTELCGAFYAGIAAAERAGLRWTRDVPTVDGWYWYRLSGEPAVYEVRNGTMLTNRASGLRVNTLSGEWAGPIVPPG